MIKKVLFVCFLSGVTLLPSLSSGCDGTPTGEYGLFGVLSEILMTPTYVASELFGTSGSECTPPVACPCSPRTSQPAGKIAYATAQTYYCPMRRCFVVCAPVSPKKVAKQPRPTLVPTPIQQPSPREEPPAPSGRETIPKQEPLKTQHAAQPAETPVPLTKPSPPQTAEPTPVPGPSGSAPSMETQVAPATVEKAPLERSDIMQSPSPAPLPESKPAPSAKPSKRKSKSQAPCGMYYPPSGCYPMPPVCR